MIECAAQRKHKFVQKINEHRTSTVNEKRMNIKYTNSKGTNILIEDHVLYVSANLKELTIFSVNGINT
jgi:hypothetical protein